MFKKIIYNKPESVIISEITINSGEEIYLTNEIGNYVYILISGNAICQTVREDGSYTSLSVYDPYSIIGEIEIFYKHDQVVSIEANSKCNLIRIDKNNFLNWLRIDFEFNCFILEQLSRKLIAITTNTTDFVKLPVKLRVSQVIESYHNKDCLNKLTKLKLSTEAFAPIRSINRALKSLVDEGKIVIINKVIEVL